MAQAGLWSAMVVLVLTTLLLTISEGPGTSSFSTKEIAVVETGPVEAAPVIAPTGLDSHSPQLIQSTAIPQLEPIAPMLRLDTEGNPLALRPTEFHRQDYRIQDDGTLLGIDLPNYSAAEFGQVDLGDIRLQVIP